MNWLASRAKIMSLYDDINTPLLEPDFYKPRSLLVGFIVSFVSHFFLDGIPHNDYIYFAFKPAIERKPTRAFFLH